MIKNSVLINKNILDLNSSHTLFLLLTVLTVKELCHMILFRGQNIHYVIGEIVNEKIRFANLVFCSIKSRKRSEE